MAPEYRTFSRRTFLGGAATSSLVAVGLRVSPPLLRTAVHRAGSSTRLDDAVEPDFAIIVEPAEPVLTLSVDRDTDMMLADFSFYGFTVDKTSSPTRLVATTAQTNENWIGVVVQLAPQAIGEADYAYPPANPSIPFDPTPVLSQVAGPSRLAFTFTTGDAIPLPTMTAADLLDWSGWTLSVAPTALTGTVYEAAVEPRSFQTSIEAPLALFLSPVVDGQDLFYYNFTTQFENRYEPFTSPRKVTECWTTELTSTVTTRIIILDANFVGGTSVGVPQVAAVWASDYSTDYVIDSADNATPQQYIQYSQSPPVIE
jgi:hypothetical protein